MSNDSEPSRGTAVFSAFVGLAFPRNPVAGKGKYLELDAELYIGPERTDTIYGALRLYNSLNIKFSDESAGLYVVQATFAKAIPLAIMTSPDITPPRVAPHEYQFMGDIHEITFICRASACEDPDDIYAHIQEPGEVCPAPKSLPINHAKPPYVTVGGLAVNIDMAASTFELEINLYLSAIRDKPSLHASTPIRCVFDNSPRWNNHKPMPYNSRQGFVVVTGNITGFILSKVDASGHQSIERFIVTIRDVYFMGVVPPKKNQPSNHALPNTLDSPGISKRGKPGLLFGGAGRGSKSQTATPTASPLIGAASGFSSPKIASSSAFAGPSSSTVSSHKRPRVD